MNPLEERLPELLRAATATVPVTVTPSEVKRRASQLSRRHLAVTFAAAGVLGIGVATAIIKGVHSETHPTATAPSETSVAAGMCNAALANVASATETTVGEVRSLTIGPGSRPAPNAFPGVASTAPAAWCWVPADSTTPSDGGDSPGHDFTVWAVGPGGATVRIVTMGAGSATPSGPPVVP